MMIINNHCEITYPEEGIGFLIGHDGIIRIIENVIPTPNLAEHEVRHKRYFVAPQDILRAEQEADSSGLEIVGVFHSHPDHPCSPSGYDHELALPGFSYIIMSVRKGKATDTRCLRLHEDGSGFIEEAIQIVS